MTDWDLAQLRALAAATDLGTFDAAARALHVTPSAVSQRIKALEQTAGAVLLRRERPVRPPRPASRWSGWHDSSRRSPPRRRPT